MYSKVILENGVLLSFIPDCYKNQKTCGKVVDYHYHLFSLELVRDCYKTQKMFDKAIDICPSAMEFVREYSFCI